MGKGRVKQIGVWDRCVADLLGRKARFRMVSRAGSQWIYIREYEGSRAIGWFSSGCYRASDEQEIEHCHMACLRASALGSWAAAVKKEAGASPESWKGFADSVLSNLRARVKKEGSRKNAEGHLSEIASFKGEVNAGRLESWALEKNPMTAPGAFRNRVETLSHIHKSELIDLKSTLERLRAKKPTGAARRDQESKMEFTKAIPPDDAIEAWLDKIEDPTLQWTFALIATYGLRPSEAWHSIGIVKDDFLVIPATTSKNKKGRNTAAVPRHWVKRYGLKTNFKVRQQALQERWPVRFDESNGWENPINNSGVANSLYHYYTNHMNTLEFGTARGEKSGVMTPFLLRHCYAIRCFNDPSVYGLPMEEIAAYMGHGVEIHRRAYLRHNSESSELKTAQNKYRENMANNAPKLGNAPNNQSKDIAKVSEETEASLLADIAKASAAMQEMLAKLSQRKAIENG